MFWTELFRIILATILGGIIGLEREFHGKPAGLRTNLLICLGAAVFTLISKQMVEGTNDSLTRIVAQIVTGVGFLGAGAIIQDRGGIHGLTTAATIWLVASIGIACGAGLYSLAILTTIIAIFVLIVLGKLVVPFDKYADNYQKKRGFVRNFKENRDNLD
jgi:putative Mg2+ transporter-C (MgtC) family protein